MKKQWLLLITFIIVSVNAYAQSLSPKTSFIGFQGGASHYWLYNKMEFNAPDTAFGVNNDSVIINGYTAGISFGHFFSERTGLELQVLYSDQTQYYMFDLAPDFSNNFHNGRTQLKYLRFPVKLYRRHPFNKKSYLTYYGGLQFSWLIYALDYDLHQVRDSDYQIFISENDMDKARTIDGIWTEHKGEHMDWRYHRFTVGLEIGLQYEYFITSRLSVFSGINASADLRNIDNINALQYLYITYDDQPLLIGHPRWAGYRIGPVSNERNSYDRIGYSSHNIHIGAHAGLRFWFWDNTLNFSLKKGRPLKW